MNKESRDLQMEITELIEEKDLTAVEVVGVLQAVIFYLHINLWEEAEETIKNLKEVLEHE